MGTEQPYLFWSGKQRVETANGSIEVEVTYKQPIKIEWYHSNPKEYPPAAFHLHWADYANFCNFLIAEGENRAFQFTYYLESGMDMLKGSQFGDELLIIEGKKHRCMLGGVYRMDSTNGRLTGRICNSTQWDEYEDVVAKEMV